MNSEKEMLEQMKNDLDKLNDMLNKSEGKNYYSKEKAKVICKIIAPFFLFFTFPVSNHDKRKYCDTNSIQFRSQNHFHKSVT